MLKERLQILVTVEQRRLLEEEAGRREMSVGALVRKAIDEQYGTIPRDDRRRAVAEIARMDARDIDPAELADLIAEEHEELARGLDLGDGP